MGGSALSRKSVGKQAILNDQDHVPPESTLPSQQRCPDLDAPLPAGYMVISSMGRVWGDPAPGVQMRSKLNP